MTSPAAVVIRRAVPDDADAIGLLHIRSWRVAYRGLVPDAYLDRVEAGCPARTESIRARLGNLSTPDRCWLAERDAVMLGFAFTRPSEDADAAPSTGEVQSLYLDPDAVGQGIGLALFAHAVEDLQQRGFQPLTLWVLDTNAHARRFYEAAGWEPDGATKDEERSETVLHELRYRLHTGGALA